MGTVRTKDAPSSTGTGELPGVFVGSGVSVEFVSGSTVEVGVASGSTDEVEVSSGSTVEVEVASGSAVSLGFGESDVDDAAVELPTLVSVSPEPPAPSETSASAATVCSVSLNGAKSINNASKSAMILF